jgi:hypothetical protein
MAEEDACDHGDDEQDQTDAYRFAGKQKPAIAAPFRVPQTNCKPGKFLSQRQFPASSRVNSHRVAPLLDLLAATMRSTC